MGIYNGTSANDVFTDPVLGANSTFNANWSAGSDRWTGLDGNDTYYVNSWADEAIEAAGQGIDTVVSRSASYTLGAHLENLTLDLGALTGNGNDLGNVLTGNALANTLDGRGGNDVLWGGSGSDTLYGGNGADALYGESGDDTLYGQSGQDTLSGGTGNDTLEGGSGNDELWGGAGNDTLRGGGGDDDLWGGADVDFLDGGTGADVMRGGSGSDAYVVDSLSDTVIESAGAGYDIVYSSVSTTLGANLEELWLTADIDLLGIGNALDNAILGAGGNDTLRGGAGDDYIDGNGGDDLVAGGTGNDLLAASSGADRFRFDEGGSANADHIVLNVDASPNGYSHADDSIVLGDRLDGSFDHGVQGLKFDGGVLLASLYHEGSGSVGGGLEASGIYVDTDTGAVRYNPTSGLAGDSLLLVTIDGGFASSLDASDFLFG